MSDLISRKELLESFRKSYCGHLGMENSDGMIMFRSVCRIINEQPTVYDVGKIVEELEKIRAKETCNKEKCDTKELCRICVVDDAIKIVKHGGVRNNRKDCEYRHDNGNCLKVGGTAVDNKHCEKLKQGGVSDDVCEWKVFDNSLTDEPQWVYKTTCGKYIGEEHTSKAFVYCPYCGKKIKVVE